MAGAGTDKTKRWIEQPSPIVILVEPQLGDNIGTAARAMANFGLSEMRLVKPRDAWPNPRARITASGADRVLDAARLFDTVEEAIADCSLVYATTARAHDQAKPVVGPEEAAREMAPRIGAGERVALMFGRERWGLENDEVGLADRIVTLPVNPAFASLNLAQAVLILGYEWFKLSGGGVLPFEMPRKSPPAPKEQLLAFFTSIERELEAVEFFRPPEKRTTMQVNLRNIFTRMEPTQQDIQTLHGIVMAIAQGRKGPARGGILTGDEAVVFRRLLASQGGAAGFSGRGPAPSLARFLRRNPTEAERALWNALVNDRRFAGHGFKRQVPIGPHMADFVSFPLRTVVELLPEQDDEDAAKARAAKLAWLRERGYRVLPVESAEVAAGPAAILDRLTALVSDGAPSEATDAAVDKASDA